MWLPVPTMTDRGAGRELVRAVLMWLASWAMASFTCRPCRSMVRGWPPLPAPNMHLRQMWAHEQLHRVLARAAASDVMTYSCPARF